MKIVKSILSGLAVMAFATLFALTTVSITPAQAASYNCVDEIRDDPNWHAHYNDAFTGVDYAKQFADAARAHLLKVDGHPQQGDVVVMQPNVYGADKDFGHVAIVTKVGSGTIDIRERNPGPPGSVRKGLTVTNGMEFVHLPNSWKAEQYQTGTRTEQYQTGTRTEQYQTGTRAEQYQTGTRAEQYQTGTRAEQYQTGTRTEQYQTGTRTEQYQSGWRDHWVIENWRLVNKREPVYSTRQVPVYGTRQVPVYSTRQVPVYGTRQVPVYSTRQVPVYGTRQVPVYGTRQVPVYSTRQVPVYNAP